MAGDGYRTLPLSNVADFRNGKSISPEKYSPTGKHPVFGANGQIARTDDLLNPESAIAIGRVGAYCGSVHYISEPSWVTDNAIVATPKKPNDLRFLFYLLRSLDLRHTAIGSAQPLITQGGLKVVQASVPPLKEQQAIACILGALDDKIELNRRTNKTLEAMAQATFKSWFVDFDPVRAKADGRDPGLPKSIAPLFPDTLEESELGDIPKGWRVGMVQDLGDVICGKTPPTSDKDNYGNDIPFVTIPDMHGKVFVTAAGKALSQKGAATQKNKFLPPFSICVSCIATPGLVALTSTSCQTNQQINSVVPSDPNTSLCCYFLLRGLGDQIRSHGAGGSVLLNLNKGQFSVLKVIVPPSKESTAFQKIALPILNRILNNEKQCQALAAIRDALLPKLLSGEIRVPQAEKPARNVT